MSSGYASSSVMANRRARTAPAVQISPILYGRQCIFEEIVEEVRETVDSTVGRIGQLACCEQHLVLARYALITDLDLALIDFCKPLMDAHGQYSRPELFSLLTDRTPASHVRKRAGPPKAGNLSAADDGNMTLEGLRRQSSYRSTHPRTGRATSPCVQKAFINEQT